METYHKKDGFKNEKLIIVPKDFFSTYQDHPLVKPLFVTDIGYFPHAFHHYRERYNGIDENILIYCIRGEGDIRIPGEIIKLNEGEVFCIPAETGHRYSANKSNPWSILWVHFKGSNSALFPLSQKKIIKLSTPQENNALQYLFTLLIDILEHNYTLGNFIYASQLLSLMLSEIYLKEKSSNIDKHNHRLTKVIRYMLANLDIELSLDQIADHMELSKSYLNSIFKKYTQRSPMDYYIHLKIQQACKYLKMTNMLVYEVSEKVGYRDPCYFSRLFRKVVGISPREYQKRTESVVIAEQNFFNKR